MKNDKANYYGKKVFNAEELANMESSLGLGARDTLRLEMGYCLYRNDIDSKTSPLRSGSGMDYKIFKILHQFHSTRLTKKKWNSKKINWI